MPEPPIPIEQIATLVAAQRFAQAIDACDEAIRRGMDLPAIHGHRARALYALGRSGEARDALSLATSAPLGDASLARSLGEIVLAASGDHGRAASLFARALLLNPADRGSYFGLAEC